MADETCQFGDKQKDACIEASSKVDNITNIEEYPMPDNIVNDFTDVANMVKLNATASNETIAIVEALQYAISNYTDCTDNANYNLIDILKVLAEKGITAHDLVAAALMKMNEDGTLHLVPCFAADAFVTAANQFVEISNQNYQEAKIQMIDNMYQINAEVQALTEALKVNPEQCVERMVKLIATLQEACTKVENEPKIAEEFAARTTALVGAAQKAFTSVLETFNSVAPQVTV